MKALNIQIEDQQHEWLRKQAFETRESIAQIVRGLINRAMGGGRIQMTISGLIQAVEEGRTLRQVLEEAYGKPAEQIGTEAPFETYQHDLDEQIIRVYAAFDDRGRATGDVALVAGHTVWQDCETMNMVTSVDEELEDTFRQTWVRVYPDMDAVLAHNNAYDTVLIANATSATVPVGAEVFADFADRPGDWTDWSGGEPWSEHGDTIGEAAPKFGQVVAYYDGDELVVVDSTRWAERRGFYGMVKIDLADYTTEYSTADGTPYKAIQLPWKTVEEILGHKHAGDADDDEVLVRALRDAGAPAWVDDAAGWIDEFGWGLIGPAMEVTE